MLTPGLVAGLADTFERYADDDALVSDLETLTYEALRGRISGIAARLHGDGVRPGDRIAIVGGRDCETLVTLLAVLWAGATYTVLDRDDPPARRQQILRDLDPARVIEASAEAPDVTSNPAVLPHDENLMYVMYTSGSTGSPKGVMIEQQNVTNMLASVDEAAPAHGRPLGALFAPLVFDVSVWEVFSVLSKGGTLFVPGSEVMTDPAALWRYVCVNRLTSIYLPPALVAPCAELAQRQPAVLQRILVGVEPLTRAALGRLQLGVPNAVIVNGYGPTEATVVATLYPVPDYTPIVASDSGRLRTPIGGAVRGSDVMLRGKDGLAVRPGEPGEIVISGACVGRGYLRGDRGGFESDSAGRRYATGDLARALPDGTLEFVGRVDDQLKVGGRRLDPAEIERALAGVPGVGRAMVVAHRRHDTQRLTLAVESEDLTEPELHDTLAASLPGYAVPSRILVFRRLPLGPNGKIDRAAVLNARRSRPSNLPSAVPAGSDAERILLDEWERVLDIAPLGVDDDLASLGATSLDAMRVAQRTSDLLGGSTGVNLASRRTVRAAAAHLTSSAAKAVTSGTFRAHRPHEGLWAWREMHPKSSRTTIIHAMALPDVTTLEALSRAADRLAHRHEALRTVFSVVDGQLVQRVLPGSVGEVSQRHVEGDAELRSAVRTLAGSRMDVTVRPWTLTLLYGAARPVAVLAADHLVLDGESMTIFEEELGLELAGAGVDGPPVAGPATVADRTWPTAERATELTAYWVDALAAWSETVVLPEPHQEHARDDSSESFRCTVDVGLWDAVRELAAASRTSPFAVLLAALKAFFRSRTGEQRNTVHVAVSRRAALGVPRALGHFVNVLPISDDTAGVRQGRDCFRDYLKAVVENLKGALDHADLAYEDLVKLAPLAKGAPAAPRVVLAQQPPMANRGLTDETGGLPRHLDSTFDLTVFLQESDGGDALLDWTCPLGSTLPGALEAAATAFNAWLREVVRDPGRGLNRSPYLSEAEMRRAVAQLHPESGPESESEFTIAELFAEQLATRPQAPAVAQGGVVTTFAGIDALASTISERLPPAGACVAVLLDKGPNMVAAMLAIARSGSAYVPLSPRQVTTRTRAILEGCGARQVVTSTEHLAEIAGWSELEVICLDLRPDEARDNRGHRDPKPQDAAYVMPTSGSSGTPKLVVIPHQAVSRLVRDTSVLNMTAADRCMLIANSSFDAATLEVWGPLLNGGCVVVVPQTTLDDPQRLCRALEDEGVSTAFFTTTLFERLLEADPERLKALRTVLVGGEAVPVPTMVKATRSIPLRSLVNGYGPTENTTFSCCYRLTEDPAAFRSIPIGRPLSASGAAVVTPGLKLVVPGHIGEIVVAGSGLATGYANDAELTAEKFPALGAHGGIRVYRTGDLGRLLPDGSFEYLGRLDRQLKVRGYRIDPAEIETVLLRHPAVGRAVVYVRKAPQGNLLLAAAESQASNLDLRAWLLGQLPEYMVPTRVAVVPRFAMTENGKIDLDHIDFGEAVSIGTDTSAIRGTVELVCEAWGSALATGPLPPHADVFDLGANSMMVLAVSTWLQRKLDRPVPAHLIYECRTPAALAARIAPDSIDDRREHMDRARTRAARMRDARARAKKT